MIHLLPDMPAYVPITFGLTTLATLVLFYIAIKNSPNHSSKANIILFGLLALIILQSVLASANFFNSNTKSFPPPLILIFTPAFAVIILLFVTQKGRDFIDDLPLLHLTYLNIVRIPVEIVLYWLFLFKAIPELMTFSGRNFDILAGITAPFIAYFGFQKQKLSKPILLGWNIIALCLLLFIIGNAMLSLPTSLQKFAFEQANIGVLNFPFNLLPGFIVPVVLFGHLVAIRRLLQK